MRQSLFPTVLGVVLTVAAVIISPVYAAWLAPATIGLVLSAPLTWLTSQVSAGEAARRHGGIVTPVEISVPACYESGVAARPVFAGLQPDRLSALLVDRERQQARADLVDPFWPLQREEVHTPLATARARSERASSVQEFLSRLSREERMAIVNSTDDLHAMSFRFGALRRSA